MTYRGWIGAAVAACMASGASAQAPNATDYPALVQRLSEAVSEKYYDPNLHGADWSAITAKYRSEAYSVHSDAAFETLAKAMLANLHSSHLDLHAPGPDNSGWRPAFKTRLIANAHIVAEVSELSDARAKGVRTGDVVENWSTLPGEIGTTIEVDLLGCDGGRESPLVRRENAAWPPPAPSFRWRKIQTGPHTTLGYLRVDGFNDDGAELADNAMADLSDTSGLVIDLRGNHGGNASAVRLASYFTSRGPSIILLSRDYLQRLGHTPTPADALKAPEVERTYTTDEVWQALKAHGGAISIWSEDVGSKRYTKPVAILIGPETGSAAEGFAWVMRLRSPAIFVGERSAGALLSAEETDIGQGWSVTIPEAGIWAPDGQDYGDRAIAPQVEVPLTRQDLCLGRDRQLETALSLVSRPGSDNAITSQRAP